MANQTTNQVGIFADAVRECFDVPAPNGAEREFAEAVQSAVSKISGTPE